MLVDKRTMIDMHNKVFVVDKCTSQLSGSLVFSLNTHFLRIRDERSVPAFTIHLRTDKVIWTNCLSF